ncbi:MAG: hypothetical protein OXU27_04655 [Candidatus Poribacteria bacterium]|nr:hypothetical protein [Candidatus Poribacteria bacterium]
MRHLKPDSLPRRQTDPLWLQDYFLSTGHNETTQNATATFVKRRGRHFMVTCRHVLDITPQARHPSIALQIDETTLNFSYIDPQGIQCSVRAPEKEIMALPEVDIALACIDGSYWHLLISKKNKVAIDLDSWREPNWNEVTYCLAVGYENEGKKIISSAGVRMVETPFLNVVAELCSTMRNDTTEFTMFSKLPGPHNRNFSGMSGGAVYAVEGSEQREAQDEELFPVGIVFEDPESTKQANNRNNEEAMDTFVTPRDVLIRAVMLTPDKFDDWLDKSGI